MQLSPACLPQSRREKVHPMNIRLAVGGFSLRFPPPDRYGTSIIISFNDLFHLITRAYPLLFYLRSETFISQNSDTKDADQRNRSGGFLIISFPPVILSCVQHASLQMKIRMEMAMIRLYIET